MTRTRPEFHQLDIFLKVIQAGSFAGAARLVGLTQPAVSQAIARLEAIYGADLFDRRRGAPLALTPVGEAILPSAQLLLRTVDQHMAWAVAAAQSRTETLTIGLAPGLGSGLLGRCLGAFAQAQSSFRLHLVEAASNDLQLKLRESSIDIAFGPAVRSNDAALDREWLWDERLSVVMRQDHPLATRSSLSWAEVATLDLHLSASDNWSALLDERAGDAMPRLTVHAVSSSMLMQVVALGMGAAVGFTSSAPRADSLVAVPIDEPSAAVAIEAAWVARAINPMRERLLRCVRRSVAGDD